MSAQKQFLPLKIVSARSVKVKVLLIEISSWQTYKYLNLTSIDTEIICFFSQNDSQKQQKRM